MSRSRAKYTILLLSNFPTAVSANSKFSCLNRTAVDFGVEESGRILEILNRIGADKLLERTCTVGLGVKRSGTASVFPEVGEGELFQLGGLV